MRYWEGADRCMINKTTTPTNISSSRDIPGTGPGTT
jgi:hypothetical protein